MFRRRSRSPEEAFSQRRHDPRGNTEISPTTAALQQILDEYGLKHSIDDDGDLTVRWEKCSVYFFHYGERNEVVQARMYVNRRFAVDLRPVHRIDARRLEPHQTVPQGLHRAP